MAARILYCNCAYARVVPPETKAAVLAGLNQSGVEFEAVPDLCEMAARRDPSLAALAQGESLRVAACYPRAVKWLFASAGAPLDNVQVSVQNMRTEPAQAVLDGLLAGQEREPSVREQAAPPVSLPALVEKISTPPNAEGGAPWKPWFPVLDYTRCTNCMQCLTFCLFDVYGVSPDGRIQVQNHSNCKTECPACSRVCPEVAIMFPKYRHGPINGEEVSVDDVRREAMKVDISALLGGDIYQALRDRSAKAKSRFSKERDDDRALRERQNCLVKLQQALDIPAEVLAALPSLDEIHAKAEAAKARARQAAAPAPVPES